MKKLTVLLVVAILVGAGIGAYMFLSQALLKTTLQGRVKDLIVEMKGGITTNGLNPSKIMTFFDTDRCDVQSWVDRWQGENTEPDFNRRLKDEIRMIPCDVKSEKVVEFTLEEGILPLGGEPRDKEVSYETNYRIRFVYDDAKSEWIIVEFVDLSTDDD